MKSTQIVQNYRDSNEPDKYKQRKYKDKTVELKMIGWGLSRCQGNKNNPKKCGLKD